MKLKVVKPKPKYYKISYAMLSNLLKEETMEENLPVEETVAEPKAQVKKETKSKFANKYDKLVDEAIRKRLIDESDREMKLLELQSLTDEEFDAYAEEVRAEQFLDISNEAEPPKQEENDIPKTEAELALAKIKQSGPIIGDFSDMSNVKVDTSFSGGGNETRSLSDIKSKLDMSTFVGEDNLMDGAMEALANLMKPKTKVASKKTPMSDLKGLTKPIVHEQSQFKSEGKSMAELFSSMDWTTIGGSR